MACDQRRQGLDHAFIFAGAAIDAVHARGFEKLPRQIIQMIRLEMMVRDFGGDRHGQSRMEEGISLSRVEADRLDRMRSLLIMMGEESTSRRLRPTETSLSLR